MKIQSDDFRVHPGKEFRLGDRPTTIKPFCKSKKQYRKTLESHVEELSSLQQLHYASHRYALLLIFQGIDAAGKDGAIRHVMSGSIRKDAKYTASRNRARRNWNTTSSGARLAGCRSEAESVSSTVLIMKRCW